MCEEQTRYGKQKLVDDVCYICADPDTRLEEWSWRNGYDNIDDLLEDSEGGYCWEDVVGKWIRLDHPSKSFKGDGYKITVLKEE